MRLILRPGSRPFVATARNAPTTRDASREGWRRERRPPSSGLRPPTLRGRRACPPLQIAHRGKGTLPDAIWGEQSDPFFLWEKVAGQRASGRTPVLPDG